MPGGAGHRKRFFGSRGSFRGWVSGWRAPITAYPGTAGASAATLVSARGRSRFALSRPTRMKPFSALPGLAGLFAPGMWATAVGMSPNLVSSGFLIDPRRLLASVPNEGVRRPPKI